MAMIALRGVTKRYIRGDTSLVVLDDIDLTVAAGSFCTLMGPSGSGKSTLLNLVGGLDHAEVGEIVVCGEDLNGRDAGSLATWRAHNVGFVFQGFNLIPVLTARENVELPLLLSPLSRKERRAHAEYSLELVGLKDRMAHRPAHLSGGQEQRVAIARAVVTDPRLILADEPTGDLDRASADQILDLLQRLNDEMDKTILMVTHDARAARRGQRVVQMDKGKLLEATHGAEPQW